ncbi:MAG TPA: S26 family signal peptidase [Syntrophorhabdaceae bacterium]|nr:S26 family signal peptidase [Syntrophorhabdaceae bacterium]
MHLLRKFGSTVCRTKRLIIPALYVLAIYAGFCFSLALLPVINRFAPDFSLTFVYGNSMLPFLKDGDLVVSTPFHPGVDRLNPGMIVRFRDLEENRPIVVQHRILEVTGTAVVTMGDNNHLVPDGLIAFGQIESIYRMKIPLHYIGMGAVISLLFWMGNYVRFLCFGLPLFFYVILLLLMSASYLGIRSPR